MDTIESPPAARGTTFRAADAAVALALAAALGWAYAPNFADLAQAWDSDPSYSHGWLVVPIALYFLWHRRDLLKREEVAPSRWGWAALLVVLAARAYLYHAGEPWFENATLPLAVAALAWALGGTALLRWAWPALVFLGFMLPLPPSVNAQLADRLQALATVGSTATLQAMGMPALAEGNVIYIGAHKLEVEHACSGLAMLMTFAALIVAATVLLEGKIWEKGALLASIVPIALFSNILRIVLTAWAYHVIGPEGTFLPAWIDPKHVWTVGKLSHDAAGWAMMPVALALVWLELRLLSWLVVEEEVRPVGALFSPAR